MLRLKQIAVWQLIIIGIPALVYGKMTTAEEIREKVTDSQPYRLDSQVELVLSKDQAIRLDIDDDPHGFKECILYWQSSGPFGPSLHMLYFDDSNNLLSRGGSAIPKIKGALRQVGKLPYLTIATWDLRDDKLQIRFCISSDKQKNQREYEKWKEERQKTPKIRRSLQFKNR